MSKFIINPDSPQQRIIEAHKFELVNGYFWFLGTDNQVVSINKADYVDRIDLAS
jgi:hypothetical protein